MGNSTFSKQQTATAIAILFHAVGLAGILVFKSDWVIQSTSFNLLLSMALLFWTQEDKNIFFWLFAVATILTGIAVEIIGVNTGLLFGNYAYGDVLGIQWKRVPLIIGVNWFIVIFCSGIAITALLQKITKPIDDTAAEPSAVIKAISVITDGATLAVAFDWLIEPVAIKLGFWKWEENDVPLYNYVCWFVISLLLMTLFRMSPFQKKNKFAIHLLLIQVMFFLILRTFLP
ncbi:MAG TPA: carotenoid biosynthesis protein [Ferruginibacter sp.]|nr:carotenoid biosynthesis protein [Ferruginibacter sp.]HPH91813.1 carotenoid biosynthesis protein [Ferruginibacter sp.]